MRHAFLALSFLLAACSSAPKVNIIRPEIELVQLVGPRDYYSMGGPVEIQYGLRIANRSQEPITLERVAVQSVTGGAYVLRREEFNFKEAIAADNYGEVTFWVKALAQADRSMRANEPVTIRVVAYFDSPVGKFQQILIRELGQFPGAGRGR